MHKANDYEIHKKAKRSHNINLKIKDSHDMTMESFASCQLPLPSILFLLKDVKSNSLSNLPNIA